MESYKMATKGPENIHTTTSSGRLDLGGMGVGLMQWGTTSIDNNIVNPKGNFTEADVRSIWESCREHNIVFFDTAEGYGGGTSETRVRNVRRWYEETKLGKKDDVIVATKFLPTLWRWTKASFFKSLRGSLDRIGVLAIDLYIIHTPIHPLPIEQFVQWASDAVDDGLVRHIGISNCNAELTRRAHAVAERNGKRIECNQIMLSLLVWNSEKHRETVQTCRELDIQIVAYSPIGQGLLTDDLTDDKFSKIRAVKMTGVQLSDLDPLRQEIRRLSLKHGRTMSQVAINWVRGHGAVPLIGCRNVKQVEDAVGSLEWVLPIGEISKLDDLSLGLSLFERPLYRRCLFVIFISMLQLAYYVELLCSSLKNWCQSFGQKREHPE